MTIKYKLNFIYILFIDLFRHLVAWNSKTNPKIAQSLIAPSSIDRKRLFKDIKMRISNATSSFFDTIRTSPSVKPTLESMKRITVKTRKWAFGGPVRNSARNIICVISRRNLFQFNIF